MPGDVQVTRLRISYVAARIHDRLEEISDAEAFERLLTDPRPVRGLEIGLPFGDEFPVATKVWSRVTEGKALRTPLPADKLRLAGVPLRYRGGLALTEDIADIEVPILEAHLHPFGIAVMTTVDLAWPAPVPLGEDVTERLQEIGDVPAVVTVADQVAETALDQAAEMAATNLVGLLTDGDKGNVWDTPPHRLATVISGTITEPLAAMPAARSPLHLALHSLSAYQDVPAVPKPADAFVAQWNGAGGYGWPPWHLIYMLKNGTCVLSAEAAMLKRRGRSESAGDRHRSLLLQLAFITALCGLVHAAREHTSRYLDAFAETAAMHLGRLYGPASQYDEWGLIPQALMRRTDVSSDVKHILEKGLKRNKNYRMYKYR